MTATLRRLVALLLVGLAAASARSAMAQGVTAHVTGVVVDTSGGLVPGAAVTITNADRNWRREVVTATDGRFAFVDVLAGTYHLSIVLEGFKTVQRKDVMVASTDRVDLASLVLEAGSVDEAIVVLGDSELVQTTTAARGGRITHVTLDDIGLKGCDALGMLKLMPGIVDTNTREAPSCTTRSIRISGRRSTLARSSISRPAR